MYWQRELHHSGLNKYRVVKGASRYEVNQKADAILAQWDEQWRRVQERKAKTHEREKKQLERATRLQNIEKSVAYANELTLQAEQIQTAMDSILIDSLNPKGFDFNILKDFEKYPIPKPEQPQNATFEVEPLRGDEKYNPKASFFTKLSKKKMEEFNNYNEKQYEADHSVWESEIKAIKEYENRIAAWEKDEAEYRAAQEESNKSVDDFAEAFSKGDTWAIERYAMLLLNHIEQPFVYEQAVEAEYTVVDNIDEGVNLAAMDWQDFENLIREIFEQEFNATGGEVKITQASRDGGVDAVAFDPDPIRGGKIVIQAKRYTNVVGVSAVRDLYGTVLNEGATKGILVTTSNFGNDAYAFAQGKPLTLMNGANLLFLLEKHGHKARIDIREAKQLQKDALKI